MTSKICENCNNVSLCYFANKGDLPFCKKGGAQYHDHMCKTGTSLTSDGTCAEQCKDGFTCTRPQGHDGMHEASDSQGNLYASWYTQDQESYAQKCGVDMQKAVTAIQKAVGINKWDNVPDRLKQHLKTGFTYTEKEFVEKYKGSALEECPQCREIAQVLGIEGSDVVELEPNGSHPNISIPSPTKFKAILELMKVMKELMKEHKLPSIVVDGEEMLPIPSYDDIIGDGIPLNSPLADFIESNFYIPNDDDPKDGELPDIDIDWNKEHWGEI